MGSDPPIGLAPYEKTQNAGEIKSSGFLYSNKGEEPTEEIREILPSPDKVELSAKIDFTESLMTYNLTSSKNLNEYVLMVNQASQIDTETASTSFLNESSQQGFQFEKQEFRPGGCDIRA